MDAPPVSAINRFSSGACVYFLPRHTRADLSGRRCEMNEPFEDIPKPPSQEPPRRPWVPYYEPPREPPPINAAQGCFRVALWMVPTGFAWASALGLGALASKLGVRGLSFPSAPWIVLNIVFVLGAGWFDAMLAWKVRNAGEKERGDMIVGNLTRFFLLQLVLVPVFSVAVVFAWCVAKPGHL
jgi:hypothetical protein